MCTILQQKIVELERKLRQQHQSDSEVAVLKQTIKELEHKLKEQEHQRSVAEMKAREIGQELLETQRTESMLQIKLRDLKNNLQERTKLQDTNMMLDCANSVRVGTPGEAKAQPYAREEAMSEKEHHILRSSDSVNKRPANNSSFTGAPEVVNEKKRKGDARNASIGGEQENNIAASQNVARKRSLPGEPRVKRTSTEPQAKNLGRSTAVSKTATTTHKMAPSSRATRQPPGGNTTRGWVR